MILHVVLASRPLVVVEDPWLLKCALRDIANNGGRGSLEYRQVAEAIEALQGAPKATHENRTPNAPIVATVRVSDPGPTCADDPQFISVKGVAHASGSSGSLVRKHALALDGRMVKFAGRKPQWMFPRTVVERWIAERKQSNQ